MRVEPSKGQRLALLFQVCMLACGPDSRGLFMDACVIDPYTFLLIDVIEKRLGQQLTDALFLLLLPLCCHLGALQAAGELLPQPQEMPAPAAPLLLRIRLESMRDNIGEHHASSRESCMRIWRDMSILSRLLLEPKA